MIINEGRPGKKLPALTNPGVAGDLLTGKQLIGADGQIITGTMASVVQATPSISVSASGLITASATQSAGRVAAGTKSATKQLTTQAGKTVTPGRTKQTAVASGRYTTGTVYVAGDADLKAANIKSGVNIFGVWGTYEGYEYFTTEAYALGSGGGREALFANEFSNKNSGTIIAAGLVPGATTENPSKDQVFGMTLTRDNSGQDICIYLSRSGYFTSSVTITETSSTIKLALEDSAWSPYFIGTDSSGGYYRTSLLFIKIY